MLAFGLPARTVLGMITVETVLVGAGGTVAGVLGGYVLLRWLTVTTIPSVLPEIGYHCGPVRRHDRRRDHPGRAHGGDRAAAHAAAHPRDGRTLYPARSGVRRRGAPPAQLRQQRRTARVGGLRPLMHESRVHRPGGWRADVP
jgi:hypothetical protein